MRFQKPTQTYDPAYMQRLVASLNQLADDVARKDVTFARVTITDLPTSSAGLSKGQLWNDSGTVKVVT